MQNQKYTSFVKAIVNERLRNIQQFDFLVTPEEEK